MLNMIFVLVLLFIELVSYFFLRKLTVSFSIIDDRCQSSLRWMLWISSVFFLFLSQMSGLWQIKMFTSRNLYFLLLFLVNIVAKRQTPTPPKYDMKCDCGLRKLDPNSEKDCEESARLESGDQEFNNRYLIFCFT